MNNTKIQLATISGPYANSNDINNQLNQLWNGLMDDPSILESLHTGDVDLSSLKKLENPFIAETRQDGNTAGFSEAVLVGVTVAASSEIIKLAINAIWDKYIKPKLENRYGEVKKPD